MLVFDAFRRRLATRDSGAVDQDVDTTVAPHYIIGDPVDSGALRHVHYDYPGIVAPRAQFVAPGLEEAGILVCDDSGGAGFRQSLDATKADASGTAGNECNPTRHFELLKVHRFPHSPAPMESVGNRHRYRWRFPTDSMGAGE